MQVIVASVNEKALKSRARTRNLLKKAYEGQTKTKQRVLIRLKLKFVLAMTGLHITIQLE